MGVDGCWCAPRSSKPLQVVRSCPGGFDSHILSPTGTGAAGLLRFLCISTPQSNLRFASSPAGEPFGIALPKSCPRVRGKWHEVPKGVRLRGGCKCNEQPEVLHRGCSCLRQPLSQLRCQLPVRGAFWVPSPRMHAPDIPQIIAYMLKLTSISCFSIVMPIYIDNLMIIGYLITIRRGLCMKEINSFG